MDTIAPHKDIVQWFEQRTINLKTLEDFSVWWDGARIIIPVFDPQGKHIFNKYRRSPFSESGPKYQYDKGATSALYGAHKLPNNGGLVIVCEGELDALALRSHGFTAVSSTGGAGTFDPRWAQLLEGCRVVICYDNDLAGYRGALNVQSILPGAGIALLPEKRGVKDVTDYLVWLRDNGRTATDLAMIFDNAQTYAMQEYEVPEKMKEQKQIKQIYNQRITFAYDLRNQQTRAFQPTGFIDYYIKHQQSILEDMRKEIKRRKFKGASADRARSVESARKVDMRGFIKFDRQGFAVCPFHNEKTPSMHYILKSNKVYCFGACQKSYDVIDIVMVQRGINFSEAVEQLCKGV